MWKGTPYVHLMVQLRRFATERRLSLRQAMTVETITRQIKEEGYCVIGDVIPSQAANNLRESLSSIAAEKRSLAERREAEIKTKGHRVGTPGVTNIVMLIHETPEFAAYLADPRVLGAAKALLGPLRQNQLSGRPGECLGECSGLLARGLAIQPDQCLAYRHTLRGRNHALDHHLDALTV